MKINCQKCNRDFKTQYPWSKFCVSCRSVLTTHSRKLKPKIKPIMYLDSVGLMETKK